MYSHNFIVWDVQFNIADPESQSAVGGDVDAPYGIVPKPCHREEITYGNRYDSSVGTNRDGRDENGDECSLEEEETEFECFYFYCCRRRIV